MRQQQQVPAGKHAKPAAPVASKQARQPRNSGGAAIPKLEQGQPTAQGQQQQQQQAAMGSRLEPTMSTGEGSSQLLRLISEHARLTAAKVQLLQDLQQLQGNQQDSGGQAHVAAAVAQAAAKSGLSGAAAEGKELTAQEVAAQQLLGEQQVALQAEQQEGARLQLALQEAQGSANAQRRANQEALSELGRLQQEVGAKEREVVGLRGRLAAVRGHRLGELHSKLVELAASPEWDAAEGPREWVGC